MKRYAIRLPFCTVACFLVHATANAQLSQLQFDPAKVPQGMALHFVKSQLDGSHNTNISVYVLDRDRIESLKWQADADAATLVSARMDWSRFSVAEFKAYTLKRGAPPQLTASLTTDRTGTGVDVSFLEGKTVLLHHWPWHSYDFDFVSLGLVLPHLRDPQADFMFWRTDVVHAGEGKDFAEVGGVRMRLEDLELRSGGQLRRYSIGGAGLDYEYGRLWTNADTGLLVEYQLPIGDEPGYRDVRLLLLRSQAMQPLEWEAFKLAKLKPHSR